MGIVIGFFVLDSSGGTSINHFSLAKRMCRSIDKVAKL